MAIEKVININVQGNADEAVGSLRSQLRQAQADVAELSAKFGATSQEAIQAAKRAGELKDQIGDAKALTDAFNPDAKFKSLSASLAGVAGGFAVVQGSMALLGTESKEVEQTLLKVQGAMALSQGLQTIGESVDSFKQLGAVVKSYTIVQRISTVLQAAFNAVMAANPIGAVVVAVTALVAAGYALVKMFQESSEETKRSEQAHKALGKELKNQVEAQKNATIEADLSRDAQLKMAKASGQSAEEIRKLSVELANQEVAQKIANAQTLRAIAIEAIRVANLEDASESQKELAKNALKEFNDANEAAKTALINRRKLLIDNKVAETQEQTDLRKKATDKENEAADKKAEKEKERRKKEREEIIKNGEDIQSALNAINKKKEDKEAEAKQKAIDLLKSIEERNKPEETPLQKLEREYEENLAILKAGHESTLTLEAEFIIRKKELQDANRANVVLTEEEENNKRIEAYRKTVDAIGSIAKSGEDLLAGIQANGLARGKAGQAAMKALALVQIGADSAIAFSKMMQGTESSAAGAASVAGPAAPAVYLSTKIAFYASGAATILANLARARALLSGGGSAAGGGGGATPSGGGGAASSAPQFNVVGNSGVNQLASVMSTNQQQPPIKTYVVSSDVTSSQSLDRNIIKSATLG
jgi:hypothetical protein